ncbi:putative aldouronate transport system substrate-binding protein [Paenibacillus qinlingensis]|uniref:Aldouronate transport system substrate-binding protein n=2 Tax=Paenibacillus qinlingensis TaxID=1837343 RepID=A0ABU1NP83_9BACL|nr:putative aldouronate transport system substrate-binding protein [Paenibacillus qinlingensis]
MKLMKSLTAVKVASVFAISASLVTGCGSTPSSVDNSAAPAGSTAPGGSSAPAASTAPIKLSYWVGLPTDSARVMKNYSENMFYKELEKKTSVKVDFQHPAIGSEKEQFNLLIASGNLPDVIEYNFTTYPGGPEKAIADKVIIPLNDLIDKNAPNLKKYLAEHPDLKKDISTDSGAIYSFPAIGVGHSDVSSGFVMRKDWLKELNLQTPETMDEWTTVLRAFKEKKGVKTPLTVTRDELKADRFIGAYGISNSFYLDNGKVKYGPVEQSYKQYLTQMNAWYKEGLLDVDFATQDAKAKDSKITNAGSGAFIAFIGSGMGKYLNAIPANDKTFDLVPLQHPVLQKGQEPNVFVAAFEYRGDGSAAITPSNKNAAQTAKWLDYLYSDEGNILKSFGVEGVTFKSENKFPKYTDLIVNNPEKLSVGEAMSKYLRVSTPAPGFVGDDRYTEQYYKFDQQKQAVDIFNKYVKNINKTRFPRVSHTNDEVQELSAIMAEVETYRDEMVLKFIMGSEPLTNYDKYVQQLKNMKIDKALILKQTALTRYNSRK